MSHGRRSSSKPPPGGAPRQGPAIREEVVRAPARPMIREEVVERPARPMIREEVVVERPSRPMIREEIPAERVSRPMIREEVTADRVSRPPVREEAPGERVARPILREEVPVERISRAPVREEAPVDRVSRPMIREEVTVERVARAPVREEAPAREDRVARPSPSQPRLPAAEPGAVQLTPQALEQLVAQVQSQVEARVRAEFEGRMKSALDGRVQERVDALTSELAAIRAKLDARPPEVARPAAPSPAAQPAAPPPTQPTAQPAATAEVTPVKAALSPNAPGTPGKNRIDRFLKLMNDRGASDLHLSVGRPPIFRLGGRMEPIRYRTLDDGDFRELVEPITPASMWPDYVEHGDGDFAYELPGVCRFRVNLFKQSRGMGAVFRIIPTKLMTVHQLGLPEVIRKVVNLRAGLVLVTGPTGSGKSTTLSAIINEMNETRPMHFVTIEDPIEFVHPNKKSLMSQREVGAHSKSFSTALRAAVREDPDAVLVGEMRDLETIAMALNAAETGVLVFGTLHTNSAAKTLDRIINVFPADKQPGVRGTLASVTKCVVAQQLLRKKGGGRVAAVEILFGSNAMSSMIRDGKTHQISGLIKLGKRDGMIAMDDALKKLIEEDTIEPLAGLEKSLDKDDFRKWLKERGTDVPEDAGGH